MSTEIQGLDLVNPFPGLRPFKEGEEHFFFGRERQTDALIDKLGQTRFLAVIGSSGSGKSSLVNCGLLTALRGGLMAEAGTVWRIAQCRPAGQPIQSLASALAEPGVLFDDVDSGALQLSDIIDSNLHMSERGIVDVFDIAHQKSNTNLLIVVDQFEELFRYTAEEVVGSSQATSAHSEAAEFIKLLLHAQKQTERAIYIVLTMRSDFLGDCTRFEGLAEAINEGQYLVPRMSREERRLAISGPVAVGGARIDPVLLTRLVNDLGDDPDQLSILQHALNRIWSRWAGLGRREDALNLAHYSSIGSMKLALDHHADKAYEELTTERQRLLCAKLFKALTNKSTDRRGVRRPTTMSALCDLTGATIEELTLIIDVFRKPSRSFLMPAITQALEPSTVVDISHESLMRMWNRLIDWADEEAESSNVFQRLTNTAALHATGQAGLWRDPDLQLALEWRMRTEPNEHWASRIGTGFEQAMEFLDDSRVASDNERAEAIRRDEQERELERSKAISDEQNKRLKAQAVAAKKQRQIIGLITIGLIVTTGMAWYAEKQRNEAAAQALIAGEQTKIVDSQKTIVADKIKIAEEKTTDVENLSYVTVQKSVTVRKQEIELQYKNQFLSKLKHTVTDQKKILTALAGMTTNEAKVIRTFTNTSDEPLLLSTIDKNGLEVTLPIFTSSTNRIELQAKPLLPGDSIDINAFINQIWIARTEAPAEIVYEVGFFNENESVVFLEPAKP